MKCQCKVIPLPNVGRESHTYLTHIVTQYDDLSDYTIFFQGGEPSWGYHTAGPALCRSQR